MSQFEAALADYRNRYSRLTVRDKITGTGRRIITDKGPDGVTHKCAVHDDRNSEARFRLQQRYQQRGLQRCQPLLDILASTGNQYRVELLDGEISFTRVDDRDHH